MELNTKIRAIAFVLPQFHPIPENDEWWGKGFTEWTNVTKAKALFPGHYQPQLPADLGFYDLRLPEAREAQANIAKEHGIYGFCYYHYWFNGKRLLNKPIDEMLKLKRPDIPFMLCWANENWTRRWDGQDQEILMKQEYCFEDDKNHMRWLCKTLFSDERYIKINGCPIFIIYRHDLFPDINKTASIWRKIAKEEFGFKDLYLCVLESFNKVIDPKEIDFDAAIEFSPHQIIKYQIPSNKVKKRFFNFKSDKRTSYSLTDYNSGVRGSLARVKPNYKLYKSVTPAFDNSARRKELGIISQNSSPENYFYWLREIVENFEPFSKEENFIFINAMNEWAEGNHLEPCVKYGRQFLRATRNALAVTVEK